MKELRNKMQNIVDEFLVKNITEDKRHDFIIAAIHFNVNLNECTRYDLMRIDHKAKELANVEENKVLTDAAIYSYILFRAINKNQIPKEYILDIKMALFSISTAITEYLTYRIDEEGLNQKLYNELKSLIK